MRWRGKTILTIMSTASIGLGLGPVIGGTTIELFGWLFIHYPSQYIANGSVLCHFTSKKNLQQVLSML
jgi:MFS family permease